MIAPRHPAYLIGTHPYSFRSGSPAEIVAVVFVTPPNASDMRACYHIRFNDGVEDFVPVSDAANFNLFPGATANVTKANMLTPERVQEIRTLAEGLRNDAEHDIEDKRDIYQALMDLLACHLPAGEWHPIGDGLEADFQPKGSDAGEK